MSGTRKTLHHKNEPELAGYQVRQVGNSCSFHAISVALRMLLNVTIEPMALSDEINQLWWRGRFMRVAPNWAVTPRMQVRIVKYLADKYSLPVTATYQHGSPESLPSVLEELTSIPLITLIWLRKKAPPIYLGETRQNFNGTKSMGGHTMILAANDPDHMADDQFSTPWGFINPWKDNTTTLFWIKDEDFQKAWRFWLPFVGPNPLVLIQRTL